jgi:hypothetical protein
VKASRAVNKEVARAASRIKRSGNVRRDGRKVRATKTASARYPSKREQRRLRCSM